LRVSPLFNRFTIGSHRFKLRNLMILLRGWDRGVG